MKTGRTATGCGIITALALFAVGCDNPLRSDNGETTPEEDAAAVTVYTQTVSTASEDTTIAPSVTVTGNNNIVVVNVGDDNDPDSNNTRTQPAEPEAEQEAP